MKVVIQQGSRLQAGKAFAAPHYSQPCFKLPSLSTNPCITRPFTAIPPIRTSLRTVKAAVSLKIKDYEGLGGFQLPKDLDEALSELLSAPDFCRQVFGNSGKATQENKNSTTTAFTGLLFQPVPWSPSTRKGMPKDMEKYQESENYVIINVPPPFMFKAKVYGNGLPTRLCAIFEIVPNTSSSTATLEEQ